MTQALDDPGKTGSAHGGTPATWRKSTWSIANGQCIETATFDGRLVVRDGVDKAGPTATFTVSEWRAFLKRVKGGDLDAI